MQCKKWSGSTTSQRQPMCFRTVFFLSVFCERSLSPTHSHSRHGAWTGFSDVVLYIFKCLSCKSNGHIIIITVCWINDCKYYLLNVCVIFMARPVIVANVSAQESSERERKRSESNRNWNKIHFGSLWIVKRIPFLLPHSVSLSHLRWK